MPNRLLKEGITDSPKIDRLSPEEEVFFYRLIVVADDYGRIDARPAVLRARCFPLKESLTVQKISAWLLELQRAELLFRYQVGSEVFAEIANWEQRVRSKGRYPEPIGACWLLLDGQLSDIRQTDDSKKTTSDGLGKGKGLGKGASTKRILFDADNRKFLGVTAEDVALWKTAYPAIECEAEMAKAVVWLLENPKNRKENYGRFLANWFSRSQDKAPRVPVAKLAAVRAI